MFVDLKVGNLEDSIFSSLGLTEHGAVRVHYTFANMDSTATLKPDAALSYGTTYTVDISGVTDLAGNPMASDRTWSFKTLVGAYRAESGDLDGDGQCTATDAQVELDIAVGNVPATSQQVSAGDVAPLANGSLQPDGEVDVGDVVVILRRVAGLVRW
jgi:hypothetical protein